MHILCLRGKVDKRTERHGILLHHTDMWTQLIANMLVPSDRGEMLYWGGERFHEYNHIFFERWLKDFKYAKPWHPMHGRDGFEDFWPDVVFARGGFREYDHILKFVPDAVKVYYGAGVRFLPPTDGIYYDIILVDTEEQYLKAKKKFPKSAIKLWVKPAADNIFYPRAVEKEFDICYVGNARQADLKNVWWVYKTVPKDLKMLHLGYPVKTKDVPQNVTRVRVERKDMPEWYSKCKAGVVPYTNYDSAPRVIPEMIACGLPVHALPDVNQRYDIMVSPKDTFWYWVKKKLENRVPVKKLEKHYMKSTARKLRSWIDDCRFGRKTATHHL